jgi:HEAT repeat protein
VGPVLRQRNFRRFLYYVGVTTFSSMFLGHFSRLYLFGVLEGVRVPIPLGLVTLHLETYGILAGINLLNVTVGLLLSGVWGYLIDRFGNKPVLRLLTLVLVPLPLAWLLITPEHPFAATIPVFLLGSVAHGARNYLVTNLLYAVSPRANRTMYAAVHGVVFSIFGACSPIIAGIVMQQSEGFTATVLGLHVEAFHLLCFITVGVRIFEQYVLGGFREPRSTSARSLVRRLVQANPFVVLPRALALEASVPPHRRARAVRKLGHTGSQLATQGLVAMLDDPDPDVRHEAAHALGHTRDTEAVAPLVERLEHEDAEVRRQAAWALGQIGSEKAVHRLLELLGDPYPHVRSAAALALGRLGGQEATDALMDLLSEQDEPLEFASAATALGLLGHGPALFAILERVQRTADPILRRQLVVAVGDLLGPRHAFYRYLDEELKVAGQRAVATLRVLRRAARSAVGRARSAPLEQDLSRLEADYLAGRWAACAEGLAAAAEHLPTPADADEQHAGPRDYLTWLGTKANLANAEAAFELCVLGMFALDQLSSRP